MCEWPHVGESSGDQTILLRAFRGVLKDNEMRHPQAGWELPSLTAVERRERWPVSMQQLASACAAVCLEGTVCLGKALKGTGQG